MLTKQVVETAELKAIRESLLSVRMRDWLQLANEAPWLDGTHQTVHSRVTKLVGGWGRYRRGLWLVRVGSPNRSTSEDGHTELLRKMHDHEVRIGRVAYILMVLRPPERDQQDIVDAYLTWAEERILAPIKEPVSRFVRLDCGMVPEIRCGNC